MEKINVINVYIEGGNGKVASTMKIPWSWFQKIGITEEERNIKLELINDKIEITKNKERFFSMLTKEEKVLQIKKYEKLYAENYKRAKDFIKSAEEHFGISYRVIYKYLKEECIVESLDKVELIGKQNRDLYNIKIKLIERNKYIQSLIQLQAKLVVRFVEGKTYEELGIKTAIDIYKENFSVPVNIKLEGEKIIISKV